MKCFVCQAELTCSNMLVRHLRLVHGYLPGKNLCLKCVQSGCSSVFGTFSGFRKHLNTKHNEYIDQQFDTDVNSCSTGEAVSDNGYKTATTSDVDDTAETSELSKSQIGAL